MPINKAEQNLKKMQQEKGLQKSPKENKKDIFQRHKEELDKTGLDPAVTSDQLEKEENYASIYYSLDLSRPFELFDLRDFFYSFMYSKQSRGHIYVNLLDEKLKIVS